MQNALFADRAVCNATASVWNSLPLYITDNLMWVRVIMLKTAKDN